IITGTGSGTAPHVKIFSGTNQVEVGSFFAFDVGQTGGIHVAAYDRGPLCPADFNRDGQVDFFDYLDFVAAFADSAVSADFNRDGQVDFFDYLDFSQAFAAGC